MPNQLLLVNPVKRRKRRKVVKRKAVKVRSKRRSPVRRKRISRRRRNPIGRQKVNLNTILNSQVLPAFTAGAGALGLDMIMGIVPLLPINLTTGPLRHIIKGVGAIGLGIVAGMVVKPTTAKELAMGALTVTMHDALKEVTARLAPNIPLGAYGSDVMGYYNAGYPMNSLGYYGGAGSNIPTVGENISAPGLGPACPQPVANDSVGMYAEDWE